MKLCYKIDVVEALKQKGYNTNRIRLNKLLSESTMTKLRHGEGVGWENLETLCNLLECQPCDILEMR